MQFPEGLENTPFNPSENNNKQLFSSFRRVEIKRTTRWIELLCRLGSKRMARNGCKTDQSNFFETPSITSKKIDRLLHISCSDNAIMVVASNCIHSIRVTSYKNQPLPLSITLSSIQGTHKKLVCMLSSKHRISR